MFDPHQYPNPSPPYPPTGAGGYALDDPYDTAEYDTDDYAIRDYYPQAAPEYRAEPAPAPSAAEFVPERVDDAPTGPYDYDEVADLLDGVAEQRLDLGSVIVPVPEGVQLQVEMSPQGVPQAVHLATEHGRITVAAYAAPKSPGQWRTVTADLTESLRADGARVAVETGPWGRELFAVTDSADLRFIGADGYRWMLRLVVAGPSGAVDAGSALVHAARAIFAETVVRRGSDPLPVRDPLPVTLPQELTEQLANAHQQQLAAAQQQDQFAAPATSGGVPGGFTGAGPANSPPRRRAGGSAMQQLGRA